MSIIRNIVIGTVAVSAVVGGGGWALNKYVEENDVFLNPFGEPYVADSEDEQVITVVNSEGKEIVIGVESRSPIIYLYPEEDTEVNVQLDLDGEFTVLYPKYPEGGWTVTAAPDGTLTDENGRNYDYLYWEGMLNMEADFSEGFCVPGEDSAEFLEYALDELGLNESEANTFIMYWLPELEANEYNVISFQTENYENATNLQVFPEPDNVIRVNMAFYGTDVPVEIEPQDLSSMNDVSREGFTVVEWGGESVEP